MGAKPTRAPLKCPASKSFSFDVSPFQRLVLRFPQGLPHPSALEVIAWVLNSTNFDPKPQRQGDTWVWDFTGFQVSTFEAFERCDEIMMLLESISRSQILMQVG